MKLVIAFLVACSAVAEHDFSDEALTLLQLRTQKHQVHQAPIQDSLQESAEAESEATDAKQLAQTALAEALDAENIAEEAENPVDPEAEIPVDDLSDSLLQKPKGKRGPSGCRIGKKGKKCRQAKKAKKEADDASNLANEALEEASDAGSKADEADAKAEEEEGEMMPEVDPLPQDEAAAVGDPHMTLSTGDKKDLCCSGAVCKPCSSALLQKPKGTKGRRPNGKCRAGKAGKKCRKAEKAKKDAKDAIDISQQAVTEAQTAQDKAAEAETVVGDSADDTVVDEETGDDDGASAVGDPHISSDIGQTQDLCCKGGVCKPCPSA